MAFSRRSAAAFPILNATALACLYQRHAGDARRRHDVVLGDAHEAARRADLAGIRWLLEYEQLPANDLDESSLERFLVCRDEKGVVAAVGLEIFDQVALLRSLVVDREMRGRGIGVQLTEAAEALAHHSGVETICLFDDNG